MIKLIHVITHVPLKVTFSSVWHILLFNKNNFMVHSIHDIVSEKLSDVCIFFLSFWICNINLFTTYFFIHQLNLVSISLFYFIGIEFKNFNRELRHRLGPPCVYQSNHTPNKTKCITKIE